MKRSIALFAIGFLGLLAVIAVGAPFLLLVAAGGLLGAAIGRGPTGPAGILSFCGGVAAAYPAALILGLFRFLGENWAIYLATIIAVVLFGWLVTRSFRTAGST